MIEHLGERDRAGHEMQHISNVRKQEEEEEVDESCCG
jgi:hypothetical protein